MDILFARSIPVDELGYLESLIILQAVSATQLIPTSSPKWNKLTESICYFIAKDMQPLDTVDEIGRAFV